MAIIGTWHVFASSSTHGEISPKPLVDDGAPDSAISSVKLQIVNECSMNTLPPVCSLPLNISHFKWWQWLWPACQSTRRILGAIDIATRSQLGNPVSITHLVLSRSSRSAISQDGTRVCDIVHINRNKLLCLEWNGSRDSLELVDTAIHSSLPNSCFSCLRSNVSALINNNAMALCMLSEMDCSPVDRTIDKFHRHVYGHVTYGDIRTLLSGNNK